MPWISVNKMAGPGEIGKRPSWAAGVPRGLAWLLAAGLILSQAQAADLDPGKACLAQVSETLASHSIPDFSDLPAESSPIWNGYVQAIRSAFKETGSHALIDASPFIKPEDGDALYRSLPHAVASQIHDGKVLYRNAAGKLVNHPASSEQQKALDRLTSWVSRLVGAALGEQLAQSPHVQVRLSTPESNPLKFEEWHVDGGNISVILPLKGTGTDILGVPPHHDKPRQYHQVRGDKWEELMGKSDFERVPHGHFWIFTGSSAHRPTVHRSPRVSEERLILLIRFQ